MAASTRSIAARATSRNRADVPGWICSCTSLMNATSMPMSVNLAVSAGAP